MSPTHEHEPRAMSGPRRPRSIRTQLLATINIVLAAGLTLILVIDYRHDVSQRILERHAALGEEAVTLLWSVRALAEQGQPVVQEYVDQVCAQMSDQSSPGHHIAVRLGGDTLQAQSHRRASAIFPAAMERGSTAPTGQSTIDGHRIVVGAAHGPDLDVYVAEYVSDIRARVRRDVLRRTLALAVLGVLIALVVNLVLVRQFTMPIARLVHTVRRIASGHIGQQAPAFASAEFSFLATEISSMSRVLEEADEERTRQLHKAQEIQRHLRPDRSRIDRLRLSHLYEPATGVTGDLYDLIKLADDDWLLCVGDVSGHGVPAAMGAAVLKTLIRAATETTLEPASILAAINSRFRAVILPDDFASLALVKWSPATCTIQYASAGHETGYLVSRDGTLTSLESTGTLLGVGQETTWQTTRCTLGPDDVLLLLTDGVTEARTPEDAVFGRAETARLLVENRRRSPAEIIRALTRALETHRRDAPVHDDVTIIAAKVSKDDRPA